MNGKGSARFDTDALVVEGWLTPHPLVQIAVVLVVTITPIVLFGFGLGLIPALIIAYYLGRKKVTLSIAYIGVRDLKMKGCVASFSTPSGPPSKVSFATAQSDGERLYREMQLHVPAALQAIMPLTIA
ncbi:MAG: hypothetical protein SH847_25360 [Roseiflexaceae bacterium]|nr:hypothetical protein [Roseiflexaceae bacterium]